VITRKNSKWWIIGAVVLVIVVPAIVSVIAAVVVIASYLLSIQFHPHRACRGCNGTGRHSGSVWAYGARMCGSCGGQGRQRRWGAMFLHRDKQVRAEVRAGAAARRRARPL
jgi:hypothetical protein